MMKEKFIFLFFPILFLLSFFILGSYPPQFIVKSEKNQIAVKKSHWLLLQRKSGREFLYYGVLGEVNNSRLIKIFQVKPGNPDSSPTPLPNLLGRKYWLITKKENSFDNPETAPYFLTLDIPVTKDAPYGPVPYGECDGKCDWGFPGYFGLHGVNGDASKLSAEDLGSLGCVRHKDEDIIYLYNLLNPEKEEIRYYIENV